LLKVNPLIVCIQTISILLVGWYFLSAANPNELINTSGDEITNSSTQTEGNGGLNQSVTQGNPNESGHRSSQQTQFIRTDSGSEDLEELFYRIVGLRP